MRLADCSTEAERRAWAAASNAAERAQQGLPPQVTDPGVLHRLARILTANVERAA